MNLSFYIAKRYLFSKKSHNAINIISGISAAGVCIGSMALVCVLSVFNGFENLVKDLFSAFDPDLKITLVEGKTFSLEDENFSSIRKLPNVVYFTEVVEENVLLRFKEKQMAATVKGVSNDFQRMTKIDSIMVNGSFLLNDGAFDYTIAGVGLAQNLGLGAYFVDPLYIYVPKRTQKINLARPEAGFNARTVFTSGVFSVQQAEYDNKYLILPISLAQELFEYNTDMVTAVELRVANEKKVKSVKKEIQTILGDRFKVKDRYEQQESYFRIMQVEKWITYLILSFILLIAVFNIIGSLSMLIIDKKDDIDTLHNMGANKQLIKRIFLFEGWLISALGAFVGIVIGVLICLAQQHFGLLQLQGGNEYIVNAYPVKVEIMDLFLVFITVSVMGFLAVNYPVKQLSKNIED